MFYFEFILSESENSLELKNPISNSLESILKITYFLPKSLSSQNGGHFEIYFLII